MYFVGLDLAWGEKDQTGVAAIDSDGRLLYVGVAKDDDSIAAAVAPFTSDECVVAIDAPLIVPNETGARPCEVALNRDFARYEADARPAYTGRPEFNPPRGEALANLLGLDLNPASHGKRQAIEVFPHPATIVLFGLPTTLKYKKGKFEDRRPALLQLMTLIEGLDNETPRLRVNRSAAWVELRRRVEAATRQAHLDRDEDAVDAVLCAYIALFRYHRPDDVTTYGDLETGYIVTPTLTNTTTTVPEQRRGSRSSLENRLIRAMELLDDVQRELVAIREALR
jgi:predicted RNase H-like nuclease